MSPSAPLGQALHAFFLDHLITVKGLRPSSVRSYRDTIRLLLVSVAADKRSKITGLTVGDLTFQRVVGFLRHLEQDRGNHIRTRNQRLAAIHTLFEYIAVMKVLPFEERKAVYAYSDAVAERCAAKAGRDVPDGAKGNPQNKRQAP